MRKTTWTRLASLALGGAVLAPRLAFAQGAEEPAPAAPPAPADAPPPPATNDQGEPVVLEEAPDDTPPPPPAPPAPQPAPPPAANAPVVLDAPAEAKPEATAAEVAAEEKLAVSGHLEAAYHLSLNANDTDVPVPLRSYDAAGGNSFLFHAAHLALNHRFSDTLRAAMEVDAGHDAALNAAATAGEPASWFDLQEAYVAWTASPGFEVTVGKFVTYEGIEVVEGPMNPTVTRGFLYGLAEPVTHLGVKAHYAIGDKANIGIGIVNGWDSVVDNNDEKTLIFRLGVTPAPVFWAALSGSYGAERTKNSDPGANTDKRVSIDVTGAVLVHEMLTVNFQGNFGSEAGVPAAGETVDASWVGCGVQPVFKYQAFTAGARLEWFNDADGVRAGRSVDPGDPADPTDDQEIITKSKYINITLAPGYTIEDAFTVRAEYRIDLAGQPVFTGGKKSQSTIALAASYLF